MREIYIGALAAFPASAFPPADYIALGHLHQTQRAGQHDHIRYSGSPTPQRRVQRKNLMEVKKQEETYDLWTQLSNPIGSHKGAKFRRFAQRLMLAIWCIWLISNWSGYTDVIY